MNKNADKQIDQMMAFIQQEAKEKAEEIEWKTEAEVNATQLNLIRKRRQELIEKYKKMEADVKIKKDIDMSRLYSQYKFDAMRARDDKLTELRKEVASKLTKSLSSGHKKYAEFCTLLIVEGLIRIMETDVTVRCREADVKMITDVLPKAIKTYKELVKKEVGIDATIRLTVDKVEFLEPAPVGDQNGCLGGVWLVANGGQLVLKNTFDSRLDTAFQDLLPNIKAIMFPEAK